MFFIRIRDFIYYNRKIFYIIIFVMLLLIFFYFEFFLCESFTDENAININYDNDNYNDVTQNSLLLKDEEIMNNYYVIDIKGAVLNPGTYNVMLDSRVIDVINMAGGLLEESDSSSVNLSKKVYDEMMIIIPFKKEDSKSITIDNSFFYDDGKISINNATLSELMTIKGIGEVKANSIIDYRNKNGLFNSIDDIKNVSGIGNSTFEKIKDYIKL